jgi:hypothetical protein
LCNASKLVGNTSTESGQGSQSYSTPSTSFANKSRGKSHRWASGSINPTPTHPHHTIISLHYLRHSTPLIIISHRHRHITSSHPHHPATTRHHISQEPTRQPFTTRTMAFPLPSHTPTQISQKCRPSQIPHVQQSCRSLSRRGRRSKLVL